MWVVDQLGQSRIEARGYPRRSLRRLRGKSGDLGEGVNFRQPHKGAGLRIDPASGERLPSRPCQAAKIVPRSPAWGCLEGGLRPSRTALAVLLHQLWKTGEIYDPFYLARKEDRAIEAIPAVA